MQLDCFTPMLRMTQFFTLALGGYAKPCPIAWAMFDLLISFSVYFVFAHEVGN